MSYIGRGVDAISNVEKLDNITFNGGTTYALTKSSAAFTPVGANNILVSIDGVIQQGNFSISTTNIVFDWSPTSSNTCNFILHYGTGVLNVPADGSIVAAKMAANSVDSDSYVDGSIDAIHLSANSVDSDAYVDGSIDAVHLSANSVDSDAYVDASIDNAHLADDAVGVAELSATGTASSSTFLRGDNAWAAAGGGKLLQVVHSIYTTLASSTGTTSQSYTDTGLTAQITTSAANSKVLVIVSQSGAMDKYLATEEAGMYVNINWNINSAGYSVASQTEHLTWGYGIAEAGMVRLGTLTLTYLTAAQSSSGTVLDFKTQFKLTNDTGQTATAQLQKDGTPSAMTLYEIGA